jgi:hypothetical protein
MGDAWFEKVLNHHVVYQFLLLRKFYATLTIYVITTYRKEIKRKQRLIGIFRKISKMIPESSKVDEKILGSIFTFEDYLCTFVFK